MTNLESASALTRGIEATPTGEFQDRFGSRYYNVTHEKGKKCSQMGDFPDPQRIDLNVARYFFESSKLDCGRTFEVEKTIGQGKYGKVYRVRSMNGEFYAVKELTNHTCFRLEVDSYKHMVKAATMDPYAKGMKTADDRRKSTDDSVFRRLLKFDRFLKITREQGRTKDTSSTVLHPFVMKIYAYMEETYEMAREKFPLNQPKNSSVIYTLLSEIGIGGDLSELAFDHCKSPMKPNEAVFYLCEMTEALIWLHDIGIVHQDIKSDNIFIKANGHILVGDFGLATITPHGPMTTFKSNIDTTSHHMPPEIRTLKSGHVRVWHAIDWYSLGVLFHRLLFHRYPPTPDSISKDAVFEESKPGIHPDTWDLIKKMLACHPERRLGGGLSGGRVILSHPGLLRLLVPSLEPSEGPFLSSGLSLPNHVLKAIKYSLTHPTNQVVTRSQSKLIEDFRRRSSALPIIRNAEPYIQTWIEELRFFIRSERLIPPFIPMSTDGLMYRNGSNSNSASTSSSWMSGYTLRSNL